MEKKLFSSRKTFATEELNIFAGINFRESYQIKYIAVSNFREFAKKHEIAKLCFVKVSYFKVVEKSSGEKLFSLGNSSDASQDEITVKEIISIYSNHPTIRKIKNSCVTEKKFDLPYASTSDIVNKIIKSLNVNKAKGPDGISAKFVKMSASVIDSHLANIINNDNL